MRMKADWKAQGLKNGSITYSCSACGHKCRFSLSGEEIKTIKSLVRSWKPKCPGMEDTKKEEIFFTENKEKAHSNT